MEIDYCTGGHLATTYFGHYCTKTAHEFGGHHLQP